MYIFLCTIYIYNIRQIPREWLVELRRAKSVAGRPQHSHSSAVSPLNTIQIQHNTPGVFFSQAPRPTAILLDPPVTLVSIGLQLPWRVPLLLLLLLFLFLLLFIVFFFLFLFLFSLAASGLLSFLSGKKVPEMDREAPSNCTLPYLVLTLI